MLEERKAPDPINFTCLRLIWMILLSIKAFSITISILFPIILSIIDFAKYYLPIEVSEWAIINLTVFKYFTTSYSKILLID